jgi:hypothetical protein
MTAAEHLTIASDPCPRLGAADRGEHRQAAELLMRTGPLATRTELIRGGAHDRHGSGHN